MTRPGPAPEGLRRASLAFLLSRRDGASYADADLHIWLHAPSKNGKPDPESKATSRLREYVIVTTRPAGARKFVIVRDVQSGLTHELLVRTAQPLLTNAPAPERVS